MGNCHFPSAGLRKPGFEFEIQSGAKAVNVLGKEQRAFQMHLCYAPRAAGVLVAAQDNARRMLRVLCELCRVVNDAVRERLSTG